MFIRMLAAAFLAIGIGVAAFIYLGAYNVAATARHWAITQSILDTVRDRSIRAHAAALAVPSDLEDQARIVAGTSHFDEHCSLCHSAPGAKPDEMTQGMNPKPPELTNVARKYSPAELFWILRNGIKMSAMPSWNRHSDDDLWNTVAFLERLPRITEEEYAKLVEAVKEAGGYHVHGEEEADDHRHEDGDHHAHGETDVSGHKMHDEMEGK